MSIPVEMEGGYPVTPDTRTTENPDDVILSSEPLTEAGRRVHNARHKGSCPADYGEECWTLTDVLDIEAEAAQGAAPRMAEPPYCLLDERGGCIDPRLCEHKPQGAAPRAEGLDERIVLYRLLAELHAAIRDFSNDQFEKWPEYRDVTAYFRDRLAPQERRDKEGTE